MEKQNDQFKFEISLSVLNHLGRNLYRNFITVIGEAISNSWDADANNVKIIIDKEKDYFFIIDDGIGMTKDDFQHKFLKVGYSKRKSGGMKSPGNRPYIGAKGIGKLALLSCANVISIYSKTKSTDYIGGVINNSELDQKIIHDNTTDQYQLGQLDEGMIEILKKYHNHGTAIIFKGMKENIRSSVEYLRKMVALYFRFSLLDSNFNIYINGEIVSLDDLKDLCDNTEFLWSINGHIDPIYHKFSNLFSERINIKTEFGFKGFVASVMKPRNLKILGTEEKAGIDLFVNGRLRERDILKHLPDYSTRFVASYLYGQIHFDELDADIYSDRFTSSREGIVPGDPLYNKMISLLKKILENISDKWDKLRLEKGKSGDMDNPRLTKKERNARNLFNLSSSDFKIKGGDKKIDDWLIELMPDADFNIPAYVDCFLSENLIRKYIEKEKFALSPEAEDEIEEMKKREHKNKNNGNISISIRKHEGTSYLDMDNLANLIDKSKDIIKEASLARSAKTYKPLRDAMAHTALLTKEAKTRLNSVYDDIKARLVTLLNKQD